MHIHFIAGNLAQRERKNPRFVFLKPTHMLFIYFTSLVDSYAQSLQPSEELLHTLELKTENTRCLSTALRRWEWLNEEREIKGFQRSNLSEEHNDLSMNVDWYDFTIVETIPFAVSEMLIETWSRDGADTSFKPADVSDDDNSNHDMKQEKADKHNKPMAEYFKYDEDVDRLNILNVANYVPRVATVDDGKFTDEMLDPISGRSIPLEQISNHMRIQLMDQRWNEQQKKFMDKQQDTGFAEGTSINDSLKSFARQRGDIFGNGNVHEVDGYSEGIVSYFSMNGIKEDDENSGSNSVKRRRYSENFSGQRW